MSLHGSKTTSAFIEWEKLQNTILKLERDGDWKFALLFAIGSYTGLRISDILSLTWTDVVGKDVLSLVEKKTGKHRTITLNPQLQEIVTRIHKGQKKAHPNGLIFLNRRGTHAITPQYVNHRMKDIAVEYKLSKDPSTIKSHSLRKSFGRRVFEVNDNSEKSLILLSDVLQHSSVGITRRYLGLTAKEISDVYVNL
jgi:integrase